MDEIEASVLAALAGNLTQFVTYTEPPIHGFLQYQFEWDSAFFPERVKFNINPEFVCQGIKTALEDSTIRLEKGMVVRIRPSQTDKPYPEEFIVEIVEITEDSKNALAVVKKPEIALINIKRPLLRKNPEIRKLLLQGQREEKPPFTMVTTLVNFEMDTNSFELDENTCILRLSEADKVELAQYINPVNVSLSSRHNKPEFALCFRALPKEAFIKSPEVVLLALQLFKAGDVDIVDNFRFIHKGGSLHNTFDRPPYREDIKPYYLTQSLFEEFKKWLFQLIEFENMAQPDSVIKRAIHRFQKTYLPDLPTQRVTDAVIGLEALISLGTNSETTQRFAQRIGFLLAKQPEGRLKWAALGKELYSQRSQVAHTGVNNPIEEVVADKAQNTLRLVIRKVCDFESPLRDLFFNRAKEEQRIVRDGFFENLIAFGSVELGFRNWLREQEAEEARKANSKPKPKAADLFNENEENW